MTLTVGAMFAGYGGIEPQGSRGGTGRTSTRGACSSPVAGQTQPPSLSAQTGAHSPDSAFSILCSIVRPHLAHFMGEL